MILIDSRTGSRDILPLLKPWGVDAAETHLDSGDFAFLGSGPDGDALIGVERKRIQDLVNSMQSGRLSGHQLPIMLATYDYSYLIVEGVWKSGPHGELQVGNGRPWHDVYRGSQLILYRQIDHYLTTLELRCGIIVRRTAIALDTAVQLASLYDYWSKPWLRHRSHHKVYAPVPEHKGRRAGLSYRPETEQQRVCREIASRLPGIDDKCWKVAEHFKTSRVMINATAHDWVKAKVGVGKTGAKKIVEALG